MKAAFREYCARRGLPDRRYLVHGWLTCLRRDELQLGFHTHSASGVSGNLPLEVSPCAGTHYLAIGPDDDFAKAEVQASADGRGGYTPRMSPGRLTLFGGSTPHRVAAEPGGGAAGQCDDWWARQPAGACRTSVAFDIAPDDGMPSLYQAVQLHDPADPEWVDLAREAESARRMDENLQSIQRRLGLSGRLDSAEALTSDLDRLEAALHNQAAQQGAAATS